MMTPSPQGGQLLGGEPEEMVSFFAQGASDGMHDHASTCRETTLELASLEIAIGNRERF
jgi:hypothetical protein